MGCPTSPAPNSQSTPPFFLLSTGRTSNTRSSVHSKGRIRGAASTPGVAYEEQRGEAAHFIGGISSIQSLRDPSRTGPGCLASQVAEHPLLQCSKGFRFVLTGQATCDGSWQLSPVRPRGCEECRHALCDRDSLDNFFTHGTVLFTEGGPSQKKKSVFFFSKKRGIVQTNKNKPPKNSRRCFQQLFFSLNKN